MTDSTPIRPGVAPIPGRDLQRIFGQDLYANLAEQPDEPRRSDGWWLVHGILGALCWLGILWLAGAL